MAQPQMILDYAGPRKRSRFRLASKSLLESRVTADEGVVVREWLAGQREARLAILATLGMLAASAALMMNEWRRTDVRFLAVLCALVAAALALIPVIVQQSWRETSLRAWDGTLRLRMGGPLARRAFAWRFDEVDAVRVIVTQGQLGAEMLAEIEILAARTPPIRLFTDHLERELVRIHGEIEGVMRAGGP
jgi:hypothetical protein